jgi:hypothetical protein
MNNNFFSSHKIKDSRVSFSIHRLWMFSAPIETRELPHTERQEREEEKKTRNWRNKNIKMHFLSFHLMHFLSCATQ